MTPFLGSIMAVSFNFAPKGWTLCNGQLLPINQNQAIFSLLGTTFGGDGRVNFALPNLQGNCSMGVGNGHTLGERGGEVAHTLSISEMPAHTHAWQANSNAATTAAVSTSTSPNTNVLAQAPSYTPASGLVTMAPGAISTVGGSQPHNNASPYLVLNFCIALQGIFPSQT